MTESTGPADGNEIILARFVAELEQRGTIVVNEFAERYPALAGQFHDFAKMGKALDHSRPDAEEPLPDKLGEFRIVRRIARGGMGDIFEAYDERLNRRVAIKTIRHGRISADNRDRFLREQTVLAQLHQTHIVPIHTAGDEGDLQYFAMPYIDGAALHHVIAAARKLDSTVSGSKTPSLAKLAELVTADSKERAKAPTPDDANQQAKQSTTSYRNQESPADSPTLSPSHPPTLSLSHAYFRSVAEVLADAADAIHHAHGVHILHRDVKPSNIMVDTSGQCWIIDFGLAGFVEREENGEREAQSAEREFSGAPLSALRAPALHTLTLPGAIQGTPQYMAPEQYRGAADVRSDVWGLGVTLYELLTLRRAFDESSYDKVAKKIATEEPTPAREVVPRLPRDLDAIYRKAMQKEPGQRYPTAKEFADDLRRWLRMEPTRARPAWPLRRVAMWARRDKGWAAAMGVAAAALVALSATGFFVSEIQKKNVQDLKQEQIRASHIHESERIRHSLHGTRAAESEGWSDKAWREIQHAARTRTDRQLQGQAAASLIGIDSRQPIVLPYGASYVAYDRDGTRLLLGGLKNQRAKVWGTSEQRVLLSGEMGAGPVAFNHEGAPVQLLTRPGPSLVLWDLAKRAILQEFRFRNDGGSSPERFIVADSSVEVTSMSSDAQFVAAIAELPDSSRQIAVWRRTLSSSVFEKRFPNATALAFSTNGDLLAVGHEDGAVTLWSVPAGETLATMPPTRSKINCLAFDRRDNRLAVGDAGGTVTIWNLKAKLPVICRSSYHGVYAVAFSPDATIVASAGQGPTRLWDGATARLLLELHCTGYSAGVTFAPDGKHFAVGSGDGPKLENSIWSLEYGRGIDTLRGLAAQITLVRFSPDGRYVAALSHNWQIGIWDVASGRLRFVFEAPKGVFADNAALAFSHDGRRFAFSAGKSARAWDLEFGSEVGSWDFYPGMVDQLAFDPEGGLHSFRVETNDRRFYPDSDHRFPQYPRVFRIRELHGKHDIRLISEINKFNRHVFCGVTTPDGSCFVADVLQDGPQGQERSVIAFSGSSGEVLWRQPLKVNREQKTQQSGMFALDPSGRLLAILPPGEPSGCLLCDMATGQPRHSLEDFPWALGAPPDRYCVRPNPHASGEAHGFLLFREGKPDALIALGIDSSVAASFPQFNPAGTHVAWGNPDGSVTVCDIEEVRRRLNKVGLGWE